MEYVSITKRKFFGWQIDEKYKTRQLLPKNNGYCPLKQWLQKIEGRIRSVEYVVIAIVFEQIRHLIFDNKLISDERCRLQQLTSKNISNNCQIVIFCPTAIAMTTTTSNGPSLASSSAFRFCLSGRRRKPSPVNNATLPVMNAREQRRRACPQDSSDRDLEYHRLCVNSNRSILSHVTQSALAKFVFANDLPNGTHTFVTKPEDVYLSYSSEFMLKTSDNELCHCYWLPVNDPCNGSLSAQYSVLYLHGASGNIGHRLEVAKIIQKGLSADVLLLDYRGFGRSTGQPSELGTYLDAQAGLDWILARHSCNEKDDTQNEFQFTKNSKIVVFGTSLGAAIAMHLASQEDNARHLHAVIVENCFTSICEISRYYVPNWVRPLLDLVKSTLVCPMFDCLSKASRIRCSVLYLVGLRDPVVPSWMSQVLYSQTNNSCRKGIREFPEGRHNDLPSSCLYSRTVIDFLNNAEDTEVDNDSLDNHCNSLISTAANDVCDGITLRHSEESDDLPRSTSCSNRSSTSSLSFTETSICSLKSGNRNIDDCNDENIASATTDMDFETCSVASTLERNNDDDDTEVNHCSRSNLLTIKKPINQSDDLLFASTTSGLSSSLVMPPSPTPSNPAATSSQHGSVNNCEC
ncbi:hypothetical protein GJ496_010294 [Pomphorhynchus laevis]|nr:hypothetical protein GJ496_010294 [Pomphorhynchus laevis]